VPRNVELRPQPAANLGFDLRRAREQAQPELSAAWSVDTERAS